MIVLALSTLLLLLSIGVVTAPDRIQARLRELAGMPPYISTQVALPDFDPILDPIEQRLKELGEHIAAVHSLADDRRQEVARLQEGHDFAVTRSFARGVIKAIDLIEDFRAQLAADHEDCALRRDALERLEAAGDQLSFLLEANQIESYRPELGEDIERDAARFEPAAREPTADASQVGRVSDVLHAGFALQLSDEEERVIRPAQVAVYVPEVPKDGSSPT